MKGLRSALDDFRSALAFITVLPAGREVPFSPLGMIRFFPVVGLLIGVLLCLGDLLATSVFVPPVAAVLDTVLLVVLTGAFHLDGLGDTADGIFSHRSRERALEIMKDSRTGMMGLTAVVCVFCLKAAGLYAVKLNLPGPETLLVLVIVPSLARSGMLFGIRYLTYGRDGSGTGHDLFRERLPPGAFRWTLLPALLCLFPGVRGGLLLLAFGSVVFFILWFYKTRLGCITGDMLGAMVEVTEAVLFLTAGMNLS
jgi:adenosylcobinamide-GDP ribazoletransferase